MADLSRTEVEQIALLARLHLEPAEIDALGVELGAILAHFAALAQVDTADVPPMTHAVVGTPEEAASHVRADVVEPSLPVEDALSGLPASARHGDLIVVPSIIPGHES